MLTRDFFQRHPLDCARDLVGMEFHWDGCSGRIVETEAYAAAGDPACHTFFRPSARAFVDREPLGTAYVYLNYGVHWLVNILVKDGPHSGFVLLRALEPLHGIPAMRKRRSKTALADLCSGPGKLSQALAIRGTHHGHSLVASPRRAFLPSPAGSPAPRVVADLRIGISRGAELPWRFLAPDSPCLSAKPKLAQAASA